MALGGFPSSGLQQSCQNNVSETIENGAGGMYLVKCILTDLYTFFSEFVISKSWHFWVMYGPELKQSILVHKDTTTTVNQTNSQIGRRWIVTCPTNFVILIQFVPGKALPIGKPCMVHACCMTSDMVNDI